MAELTREENRKRAALGMREDRNDGIHAQHKHPFGLNSISFQDLPIGTGEKVTEDPRHDCRRNGCRLGAHYIKLWDL